MIVSRNLLKVILAVVAFAVVDNLFLLGVPITKKSNRSSTLNLVRSSYCKNLSNIHSARSVRFETVGAVVGASYRRFPSAALFTQCVMESSCSQTFTQGDFQVSSWDFKFLIVYS